MTEYPYVWNITLENFIGGFAELIYEISPYAPDPSYAVTEGTLDFQVLGLNPSDTVAETYIDANDGVHGMQLQFPITKVHYQEQQM